MKILKRLKYISHYELWMFAVVAIAAVLRFILIYSNWPITDADEGNMGILALHVAYQGDHPGFFYGGGWACAPASAAKMGSSNSRLRTVTASRIMESARS